MPKKLHCTADTICFSHAKHATIHHWNVSLEIRETCLVDSIRFAITLNAMRVHNKGVAVDCCSEKYKCRQYAVLLGEHREADNPAMQLAFNSICNVNTYVVRAPEGILQI